MANSYVNCIDSYFIVRLRQYLQGKKCADMGSYFTDPSYHETFPNKNKSETGSQFTSKILSSIHTQEAIGMCSAMFDQLNPASPKE